MRLATIKTTQAEQTVNPQILEGILQEVVMQSELATPLGSNQYLSTVTLDQAVDSCEWAVPL